MLVSSSVVVSATAFRVGVRWLGLSAKRTAPLMRLAVRASLGGSDGGRAQAEFRDNLLALARDGADVSWCEMRRGLDELDAFTRPHEDEPIEYRRPNRVKQ